MMTSYKQRCEELEARWESLRQHLQDCVTIADAAPTAINYDKSTILQVIFKMDSMKDE